MSRSASVLLSFVLDAALVVTFAAVGRASHDSDVWTGLAITAWPFLAALLQSFYKVPLYDFAMRTWPGAGETMADMLTMIINALVQFWVFFPIFKVIFKQVPESDETTFESAATTEDLATVDAPATGATAASIDTLETGATTATGDAPTRTTENSADQPRSMH